MIKPDAYTRAVESSQSMPPLPALNSRAEEMIKILISVFDGTDEVEWEDIVKAVSAKVKVKNWIKEVRVPLQVLRDFGRVIRVNDVHREAYRIVLR